MSRIGKKPVILPQGVEAQVSGQDVKIKGKLGELSLRLHDAVEAVLEDTKSGKKKITLKPRNDERQTKAIWPTMRVLVRNMVNGVNIGYKKNLEIKGVGYRAALQGTTLVLQLGYSHEIKYALPKDIKVKVEEQTKLEITGHDKQKVGQVAADIRSYRPPEPYKGKGVRYTDEYILRKEGKKK
jgi:large subunit ribosomal protein L6